MASGLRMSQVGSLQIQWGCTLNLASLPKYLMIRVLVCLELPSEWQGRQFDLEVW